MKTLDILFSNALFAYLFGSVCAWVMGFCTALGMLRFGWIKIIKDGKQIWPVE